MQGTKQTRKTTAVKTKMKTTSAKVEGLDDSEDERATAYFDGFEGIDET